MLWIAAWLPPKVIMAIVMLMFKLLAYQSIAVHGSLDPDATWTRWADVANKVYHIYCLVGPQLRERPETEPRVRLPAKAPAEDTADTGLVGMVFPEAAFQLGPVLREEESQ
eukprot:2271596-Amphidinium_carterae.2